MQSKLKSQLFFLGKTFNIGVEGLESAAGPGGTPSSVTQGWVVGRPEENRAAKLVRIVRWLHHVVSCSDLVR